MSTITKFKSYKGGDLKGFYYITYKIDGVCTYINSKERRAESKRGKPLHNFDYIFDNYPTLRGWYETYRDNWETSVSLVRTHDGEKVAFDDLYSLFPADKRLKCLTINNPNERFITDLLKDAVRKGYEGLIFTPRDEGKPIKVKPELTIDIRVTGMVEGTGKYVGKLGAIMTKYGKVGTGLTDKERENLWEQLTTGAIIEVSFMEWTKDMKMRHPRFKRVRWDKDKENLEQDEQST